MGDGHEEHPHLNKMLQPLRHGSKKLKKGLGRHSRSSSEDTKQDSHPPIESGSNRRLSAASELSSHDKCNIPELDGDAGSVTSKDYSQDMEYRSRRSSFKIAEKPQIAQENPDDVGFLAIETPGTEHPPSLMSEDWPTSNVSPERGASPLRRATPAAPGSHKDHLSSVSSFKESPKGSSDARQPSFFSSVLSAAQNAATHISSLTNSPQRPSHDQTDISHSPQLLSGVESGPKNEQDGELESEMAVSTIGKGELSLKQLGIDEIPHAFEEGKEKAMGDKAREGSVASGIGGDESPHPSRIENNRRRRTSSATQHSQTGRIYAAHHKPSNATNTSKSSPGFAVAASKRQREFHSQFKSVPEDDFLIEDYACALAKEILLQGRMFLSEGHICFSSNIFGWVTNLVISLQEVVSIEKRSTAGIFPNGIVITTLHSKHHFASFISRDTTFDLLARVWKMRCGGIRGNDHALRRSSIASSGSETPSSDGSGDYSDRSATDENDDSADDAAEKGETSPRANGHKSNKDIFSAIPDAVDGPTEHEPTECECLHSNDHLPTALEDEAIQVPLKKVYDVIYGKDNKEFMVNFLKDTCNCTEVTVSDWKDDDNQKQIREFSYVKPLNGPVGPKSTKCYITEKVEHYDLQRYITVTSATSTPDVPSGNAFTTKSRLCMMWAEGGGTRIIVNCGVEWSGKSWLKGPIEKGVTEGQTSYFKDLIKAVRKELIPASESKRSKKRRKGTARGGKRATDAANAKPSYLRSLSNMVKNILGVQGLVVGFITVMVAILLVMYLRTSADTRSKQYEGQWEDYWAHEEESLWLWLNERVGDFSDLEKRSVPSVHSTQMQQQELQHAIRVTEDKLDILKDRLHKES